MYNIVPSLRDISCLRKGYLSQNMSYRYLFIKTTTRSDINFIKKPRNSLTMFVHLLGIDRLLPEKSMFCILTGG